MINFFVRWFLWLFNFEKLMKNKVWGFVLTEKPMTRWEYLKGRIHQHWVYNQRGDDWKFLGKTALVLGTVGFLLYRYGSAVADVIGGMFAGLIGGLFVYILIPAFTFITAPEHRVQVIGTTFLASYLLFATLAWKWRDARRLREEVASLNKTIEINSRAHRERDHQYDALKASAQRLVSRSYAQAVLIHKATVTIRIFREENDLLRDNKKNPSEELAHKIALAAAASQMYKEDFRGTLDDVKRLGYEIKDDTIDHWATKSEPPQPTPPASASLPS